MASVVQAEIEKWKQQKSDIIYDEKENKFKIGNFEFIVNMEGQLFVETSSKNIPQWFNDLDDYIMETQPSLIRLLKHINKIHKKSKKYGSCKINFADDLNDDTDSILGFDFAESRIRRQIEENLENATCKLVNDEVAKKTPIMFTGQLPGKVIMNELFDLRDKYKGSSRVSINAVDNSVYHWNIKFRNFARKELNESIQNLQKEYGYDYIELEVYFHNKYYPCYPPFVKVLRPRLKDSLMNRITSMKMVQFDYWSPCRSMKYIVDKLYTVINNYAFVDHQSAMNDVTKYPDGAYHPLEAIIVKLAAMCDYDSIGKPLDDSEKEYEKTINVKQNNNSEKEKYWASGTGYGTSGSKNWNPEEYIRLQEEKDNQIISVLKNITYMIEGANEEELKVIYSVIESSYLVPFIKSYLRGNTMLEIGKHRNVYEAIFTILQLLSTEDGIFLFDDTHGKKNLFSILTDLKGEAKTVIEIAKASNDNDDNIVIDQNVAPMIITMYEMVEPIYEAHQKKIKEFKKGKNWDKEVEGERQAHSQYFEEMDKLKYATVDDISNFHYKQVTNILPMKIAVKIGNEYSALSSSLPICEATSIFLRVNVNNFRCSRVLITGPPETPYDAGIFIFDTYMDVTYPANPPSMKFLNHGGKRFNPNLYDSGKVCLSLLGTWSGSGGEKWNQNTSTLQQLFTSIQALILIEHPYFNEPNYESLIGTIDGNNKTKKYNNDIRLFTMQHAILDFLENPKLYPEFEDVVTKHFTLCKDRILKNCEKWTNEGFNSKSFSHVNTAKYIEVNNKIKEKLEYY